MLEVLIGLVIDNNTYPNPIITHISCSHVILQVKNKLLADSFVDPHMGQR